MITYDPALRDERGVVRGDDRTSISDVGNSFDGRPPTLAGDVARLCVTDSR